jgi:hypothetical protein
MRFLASILLLGLGLSAQAQNFNERALMPRPGGEGQITVQIPAGSIYQYTPVILCDSPNFEMRRFSSFFKGGTLTVDLRYRTMEPSLGASCSVYFVIDDLAEFDYETGEALHAARPFFRFVVQ